MEDASTAFAISYSDMALVQCGTRGRELALAATYFCSTLCGPARTWHGNGCGISRRELQRTGHGAGSGNLSRPSFRRSTEYIGSRAAMSTHSVSVENPLKQL